MKSKKTGTFRNIVCAMIRFRTLQITVLILGLCIVPLSAGGVKCADAKKVVFLAGADSHAFGAHEHIAVCNMLSDLLNTHHDNIVSIVYTDGWPDDPQIFEAVDAIVLYSDAGRPVVPNHIDNLGELMDEGVGLVIIHWAFPPHDRGAAEWLAWVGGNKERHWSVNPFWTLEDPVLGDHPVNRGVVPYSIRDEWYYHMRFRDNMEGVTPIMSAHPPASTLQRRDGPYSNNPHVREAVLDRGEIQHVAWASERDDGGRGFGFTGGHFLWNWGHPMFRRQVLNGIVWVAGAEIPEDGISVGEITLNDLLVYKGESVPEDFNLKVWENRINDWVGKYQPSEF